MLIRDQPAVVRNEETGSKSEGFPGRVVGCDFKDCGSRFAYDSGIERADNSVGAQSRAKQATNAWILNIDLSLWRALLLKDSPKLKKSLRIRGSQLPASECESFTKERQA